MYATFLLVFSLSAVFCVPVDDAKKCYADMERKLQKVHARYASIGQDDPQLIIATVKREFDFSKCLHVPFKFNIGKTPVVTKSPPDLYGQRRKSNTDRNFNKGNIDNPNHGYRETMNHDIVQPSLFNPNGMRRNIDNMRPLMHTLNERAPEQSNFHKPYVIYNRFGPVNHMHSHPDILHSDDRISDVLDHVNVKPDLSKEEDHNSDSDEFEPEELHEDYENLDKPSESETKRDDHKETFNSDDLDTPDTSNDKLKYNPDAVDEDTTRPEQPNKDELHEYDSDQFNKGSKDHDEFHKYNANPKDITNKDVKTGNDKNETLPESPNSDDDNNDTLNKENTITDELNEARPETISKDDTNRKTSHDYDTSTAKPDEAQTDDFNLEDSNDDVLKNNNASPAETNTETVKPNVLNEDIVNFDEHKVESMMKDSAIREALHNYNNSTGKPDESQKEDSTQEHSITDVVNNSDANPTETNTETVHFDNRENETVTENDVKSEAFNEYNTSTVKPFEPKDDDSNQDTLNNSHADPTKTNTENVIPQDNNSNQDKSNNSDANPTETNTENVIKQDDDSNQDTLNNSNANPTETNTENVIPQDNDSNQNTLNNSNANPTETNTENVIPLDNNFNQNTLNNSDANPTETNTENVIPQDNDYNQDTLNNSNADPTETKTENVIPQYDDSNHNTLNNSDTDPTETNTENVIPLNEDVASIDEHKIGNRICNNLKGNMNSDCQPEENGDPNEVFNNEVYPVPVKRNDSGPAKNWFQRILDMVSNVWHSWQSLTKLIRTFFQGLWKTLFANQS